MILKITTNLISTRVTYNSQNVRREMYSFLLFFIDFMDNHERIYIFIYKYIYLLKKKITIW